MTSMHFPAATKLLLTDVAGTSDAVDLGRLTSQRRIARQGAALSAKCSSGKKHTLKHKAEVELRGGRNSRHLVTASF